MLRWERLAQGYLPRASWVTKGLSSPNPTLLSTTLLYCRSSEPQTHHPIPQSYVRAFEPTSPSLDWFRPVVPIFIWHDLWPWQVNLHWNKNITFPFMASSHVVLGPPACLTLRLRSSPEDNFTKSKKKASSTFWKLFPGPERMTCVKFIIMFPSYEYNDNWTTKI